MKKLSTALVELVCLLILVLPLYATNYSGTYYIGTAGTRPGGGDPDFLSLKLACDAINNAGNAITGDCTFYLTSSLTEPTNIGLGKNPGSYTITFKPYTGITSTITFTQVADNAGRSGSWVIGTPDITVPSTSNYGLVTTNNIVIDGSNTIGGTTRDLTIVSSSTQNANETTVQFIGDANYCTIKNCVVTANNGPSYAVLVAVRNSTTNYVPDNITVDNCNITNTVGSASQGLAISNSGTPTAYPTGIVFSNNKITAKTRGIFLYYAGNTDVYGNEIYVNQTTSGSLSAGIVASLIGAGTNTTNIYKNKLLQLKTVNTTAGSYGIIGIYLNSIGTYNVYNNVVTNIEWAGTGTPDGIYYGIAAVTSTTSGHTSNVFYNSVNATDLTNTAPAAALVYAAFYVNISGASGTRVVNAKDNIFAQKEDGFKCFSFLWSNTTLCTMTSDYNDLYRSGTTNAIIGKWGSTECADLAAWRTASGKDASSVSGDPQFISNNELKINTSAIQAVSNNGTPITTPISITTDIEGDTRDAGTPDIGADEFALNTWGGNYADLVINGDCSFSSNISITGSLSYTSGTITDNSKTVSYGSGTTLVYNGLSAVNTTDLLFPASSGPSNLTVSNAAGATLHASRTIAGTLTLTNGTFTTSGYLTLGTGATISRSGGVLSQAPTIGTTVNVTYTGSSAITTDVELPASSTALNNLTISCSGGVTLANNQQLNGTLTLTNGTFDNDGSSGSVVLTMADGSKISVAAGDLTARPTFSGTLDLDYTGSTARTVNSGNYELRSDATIRNLTVSNIAASGVALNTDLVVTNSAAVTGFLDCATHILSGSGSFTLSSGGNLGIGSPDGITSSGSTGNIQVAGTRTYSTGGYYTYDGTVPQVTGIGLPASMTSGRLIVNNSSGLSGGVTLSQNTSITTTGYLTMTLGKLITISSKTVTIGNASNSGNASGGSTTSFVDGPLKRVWASTSAASRFFPVGKGSYYGGVTLNLTHSAATLTTYTVEQFNGNPTTRTLPGTLDKVSSVKYMNITRDDSTGLTAAAITINYNIEDGVSDNARLRIAKDDGAGAWVDLAGTGSANGTGTITSATNFTAFSDFVLANATGGTNSLPVELTAFTALPHGKRVELAWSTATETNNAGFSIERKTVGADWQTVTFIKGQGTSNKPASYSYTDNVAAGRYTYRLKQVDQNGAFKYSSSVDAIVESAPIVFGLAQNFPNPFNPTTMIRFAVATAQKVTLKIYNTAGQEVTTLFEGTANAGAMYEVPFNAGSLASGMYFSVLQTATSREVKKMTLLR